MTSGATSPLLDTKDVRAPAPELGMLTLLDLALRLAEAHLLAAYPTAEPRGKRSYPQVLADALLGHLRATRAVLFVYREQAPVSNDPSPL